MTKYLVKHITLCVIKKYEYYKMLSNLAADCGCFSGLDCDDGSLVPAVAEEPLDPDPGEPRPLQQLRGGLHLALHPRHAHPPPQLQRHHHHASWY